MSGREFNEILMGTPDFLKLFAFNLTRDNDAAKDLMQETFCKAFANREKYNSGTNIQAWMHTIMRNIFINDYRRKKRSQVIFDDTGNDFLLNQLQQSIPNTAEVNMRLKDIRHAIHKLPDIFKYPFEMFIDGYKYNEIAYYLQEPLGTIKSRIHFARRLLKENVERF